MIGPQHPIQEGREVTRVIALAVLLLNVKHLFVGPREAIVGDPSGIGAVEKHPIADVVLDGKAGKEADALGGEPVAVRLQLAQRLRRELVEIVHEHEKVKSRARGNLGVLFDGASSRAVAGLRPDQPPEDPRVGRQFDRV